MLVYFLSPSGLATLVRSSDRKTHRSPWLRRCSTHLALDHCQQPVMVNRFVEESHDASLQSAPLQLGRIDAADDDEGHALDVRDAAQPEHELETVPGGHAPVGNVGGKADI